MFAKMYYSAQSRRVCILYRLYLSERSRDSITLFVNVWQGTYLARLVMVGGFGNDFLQGELARQILVGLLLLTQLCTPPQSHTCTGNGNSLSSAHRPNHTHVQGTVTHSALHTAPITHTLYHASLSNRAL